MLRGAADASTRGRGNVVGRFDLDPRLTSVLVGYIYQFFFTARERIMSIRLISSSIHSKAPSTLENFISYISISKYKSRDCPA